MPGVAFERIAHLVTVPVVLNGVEARFVVDSGIGLTIVRDTLSGCVSTGESFTGTRMSGQSVTVPLGVAPSLVLAGQEHRDVPVGLLDMGSDVLILDERFAELGAGEARRVDGTDETGNAYTRTFATLPGRIHPAGAPELSQADPDVMFQSIVYDGLVGDAFLRGFPAVTFDVAAGSLVLARSS